MLLSTATRGAARSLFVLILAFPGLSGLAAMRLGSEGDEEAAAKDCERGAQGEEAHESLSRKKSESAPGDRANDTPPDSASVSRQPENYCSGEWLLRAER